MKDKTKYYSKETFKQEKNIETILFVLVVFLIGFIAGYACMNSAIENRQEINNVVIESEEK